MSPSLASITIGSPSRTPASSANGLGMRTARLLPHFTICDTGMGAPSLDIYSIHGCRYTLYIHRELVILSLGTLAQRVSKWMRKELPQHCPGRNSLTGLCCERAARGSFDCVALRFANGNFAQD